MTADMGYFVPHFYRAIDIGVPLVLDVEAVYAYDVLRRFVWREDHGGHKLARLYRDGLLVSSISQKKLAEMIGRKHRRTKELMQTLRKHGWVRTLGSIAADSSVLVYHLGNLVTPDGGSGRGGTQETFFADHWIAEAHRETTKHFRDARKDPELRLADVDFAERVEFVRTWSQSQIEKAA